MGHIFTAVCQYCSVSVCLCVCVCLAGWLAGWLCLWTKFQPNGWTDLDVVFTKWLLNALAQTLLKLETLGQKSRLTFFLHNSLLISLLCISALLSLIKMKFGMSLRYNLGRFVFKCQVSRSQLKVKGHRRGGVCVLWMLLVFFPSFIDSIFISGCFDIWTKTVAQL